MKWLLSLLLLAGSLWCADVDAQLYEGEQKEAYYQQIRKQIESAAPDDQHTEAIRDDEREELERVRSAASQTVTIERYDVRLISGAAVSPERYYGALNAVATLRWKQEQQSRMSRDVQAKIVYLKQSIERITEENKNRLLLYRLQFAYYKLQQKNIEAKTLLLQSHEKEVMRVLLSALPALQCETAENFEKKFARKTTEMEEALQRKVAYQIDMEKALIEESGKKEQILKEISASDVRFQKALQEKISLQTQEALCRLKAKKNKEFFALLGKIEALSGELSKESKPLYLQQTAVLREIAREVFGTTRLLVGSTLYESREMLESFKEYFSSPLFVFNEQGVSLLSLIKALVVIILGFVTGMFYKHWVAGVARRWPDMSQMSIRLASNIGYYLIVIIAFMIAMSSIGIDMSSISLIAGALSIGIGFGLQTVVSNLIAGVILMFERTIRIGDVIEISDQLRGRVSDIRIRSTTIKTFDNIDVVVPNSSFIQNNVINWTLDDISRRLHIPFSVAYGTAVEDVKKAVLDELAQSTLTYIKGENDKVPEVWMVAMNSSSVDFELIVWVEWMKQLRPNSLRSDFMILIYNALYKHGIQIPFPQLDLYVKQMPSETLK